MEVKRFISDKVDAATRRYMEKTDCDDYSVAMRAVLDADPLLKSQYTGAPVGKASKTTPATLSGYTRREVGDAINRLVMEYMGDREDTCSYLEALKAVLHSHPALAKRYTQ